MRKLISFSAILLSVLLFNSCKKVEGEGGSSSIVGRVMVDNYNAGGSILEGSYVGADEDVYIIYGDGNTYYNDKISTSYDGTFEFKYLTNGKYTIYVYEDVLPEPTNADNKRAIILSTEITKKKSNIDLGDITIMRK